MPTAPVVELRGVSKVYEHDGIEVVALRDVDLEIASGEFIVLLGPSGSGKSTLLNVLGGLDAPTHGRIRYLDEDLRIDDDSTMTWYRRERVGFVFQFYNLIPSLTALENVALITEVASNPISADEALARVGMSARANHFPSQLSGGEQQRVAIARAIAKRPQLLLCDEPTGALDREHGIEVLEAIDDVNRQLGTPTVVITHNTVIAGMADRVVRLSDGRIARVDRNLERQTARQLAW